MVYIGIFYFPLPLLSAYSHSVSFCYLYLIITYIILDKNMHLHEICSLIKCFFSFFVLVWICIRVLIKLCFILVLSIGPMYPTIIKFLCFFFMIRTFHHKWNDSMVQNKIGGKRIHNFEFRFSISKIIFSMGNQNAQIFSEKEITNPLKWLWFRNQFLLPVTNFSRTLPSKLNYCSIPFERILFIDVWGRGEHSKIRYDHKM